MRKSSGAGSGWRVWRRNVSGTWDFGPQVFSTVGPDRFDVFRNPDDGRVFVHQLNSNQSRLLRLEYSASADMFMLAASATIPTAYPGQASSLTVDTAGRVWIVTHPGGQLAYTVRDANTLAQVAPLTLLPDRVGAESLIAGRFVDEDGPAVGFVYSGDSEPHRGTLRIQRDADPVGTFTTEVFAEQVDNHATFAAADSDVVVVWKDERDLVGQPIILAKRRHTDGSWGDAVAVFDATSTASFDNHTRPRVVIDADKRQVHVAAAESTRRAWEVHERVAPIDTLEFGSRRTIFRSGDAENGHVFGDVHAGQQPVTAASGLLLFARGREVVDGELGSFSLWQNLIDLPSSPGPAVPVASVQITSVHPPVNEGSSVTVTATVDGSDITAARVAWGEGTVEIVPVDDGAASAAHTYLKDGAYTITVNVDAGSGSSASDSVVQHVNNVAPLITWDAGDVTALVDELVSFEVTFADPGLHDTHIAMIDFGDGTSPVVIELPQGERAASATHRYTDPGTRTILATVTDSAGGSDVTSRTATVTATDPDPDPDPDPGPDPRVWLDDDFAPSTNVDLDAHVPTGVGEGWTLAWSSGTSIVQRVDAATASTGPTGNQNNAGHVYTVRPAPHAADYAIEATLDRVRTHTSGTRPFSLLARYHSGGDAYYELCVQAGSRSPVVQIRRYFNGSTVVLASRTDLVPAHGDTYRFELIGDHLTALVNGTAVLQARDSSISQPGDAGFAVGRSSTAASAHLHSDWRIGRFTVTGLGEATTS